MTVAHMAGISHTEGRFTAANISMWLCAAGAGVGVAGLIGWLTGMLWLLRILPDLPPMMPNAALALIAIGIAGAVCHAPGGGRGSRAVSIVGGLVGLAIGVGTLAEYGSGIELRILNMSRILIAAQPPAPPGPPSPFTAVALVFLAAAILLIEVRPTARVRPSELLVLCAGFVTFTVLSGMILGAEPFYRLTRTPVIGTSLPTAVGLVLISIGLLVEPARGGAVRIASSPGPGGMLIRRLALPAIVVPLLLGLGVIRLLPTADIGYAAVPIAMLAASMTAIALILMVVNATPLNRAYEDAQASRTRINQLVEHAPDGIFVADLNGRYTDVNDAGCRLLGYSREEIVGKTIVDLIPPTDAERLWQSRDALMAGGVQVAEWTLRRRDGSLVPVEVSAKILEDGRWQGFVRDISERKRMEDERQVFISLLENSSDFIGIAGPDGKALYVNPAGRRMVGLSADYPVETTQIPEYYPPDQRAFVSDVIVPSVLQLGRWEGDTYFRNWQTQEPIPVSDEHFLIRDPKTGRTLGMGTVTRNMTVARRIAAERETLLAREQRARQQAESANEQLRESEERFRLALDEAPIGMALVALDGRFFRVNRVLCEIVGYTAEELTGLTFQAITHPDDLDADLALAGQLLRGEIPRYQLEKRYIRKDGTLVDIMLSGSILRGRSGEALYFISQIEDITARKRLADNLRLSEAKATGILAISSDAIVSIDEEQRITQFNEGAEKIFGYSKAEATGAPLEILIPERLRTAHHLHVARFGESADVARKMGARNTVIIGLRKNGQEFPADAAISKLDVGGNRVFTVAVRDFTEQKRIEDEQRLLARVGAALATTLEREQWKASRTCASSISSTMKAR
jgi:PAS domain S-box-containing protein